MVDNKLFLGSFLSTFVECMVNQATQSDVVCSIMRSIDPEFKDNDNNVRSTRLAGGICNPSNYITDLLKGFNDENKEEMVECFRRDIIPYIKANEISIVIWALCLLIRDDSTIADDIVVDIISGTKKKELTVIPNNSEQFLAGVFLYVLINTSNKRQNGVAKELAKEYVSKAHKEHAAFASGNLNTAITKAGNSSHIRMFCGDAFTPSGAAIIVSEWEEDNRVDILLIERLTDMNYSDVYEDLQSQQEDSLMRKKGTVIYSYNEMFREQLIENMDEIHIRKLIDSIAELLLSFSEYDSDKSKALVKACDFLVSFGLANNRLRLRLNDWRNHFYDFLKEVLHNRRGIFNVADKLEILVEADPDAFLNVFDRIIEDKESVLFELLSVEYNAPIVYPIAYSLRKAAAYRECFAGAMSLLFELSKYSNVFFDNMRYILVPNYPQTEAYLQNRIGILKNFFMRDGDTAWKLLISLLPGYCQSTSRRMEFMHYPIQMQDVSQEEYVQAVDHYVKLACTKIEHSVYRALDLVRICPVLPDPIVDTIVEAVIEEIPPYENTVELLNMINEYRVDFVGIEGKRTAFSKLQRQYETNREELSARDFFKSICGRVRDETLKSEAEAYILSKYKQAGFEGLLDGFAKYEDIYYYGEVIRRVLMGNEFRDFCYYLAERDRRSELSILISSLKSEELVLLFDQKHPKYYEFLCAHICDSFMLDYTKSFSQEISQYYWSNVKQVDNRDFDANRFKQLIDYLVQAENYETAFRALSIRIDYEEVDKNQVIRALQQYSSLKCFSDFEIAPSNLYIIREVLSYILKSSVSEDVLTDLEEKYIRFFDMRYEPKHVLIKMASNPQYVENLLISKHQKEREGVHNSSETYLISKFKVAPGYKADGSFDYSQYISWYEYALKSELSDEMLRIFAENSYHALAIEGDEFFMNRKVVEYIENQFDSNLMTTFEVEVLNSIGSVNLDPKLNAYENLKQDFEKKAELCEIEGFIKTSRVFRSVANMMQLQAERMTQ